MTIPGALARVLRWVTWPVLVLVLSSGVFVAVHVPQHRELSAYDEYVYLDYLDKVPTDGFVRQWDETGDLARDEISCRGVRGYGTFGEACNTGTHTQDSLYPYGGRNSADIYTPVYFAVTWVMAQPLTWMGISLLDAGRLVGAVWLAVGLVLLHRALKRVGVPDTLSTGLALLVLATPMIYWANTYLSTDAALITVGGALVLVGVRVLQKKTAVWWLIPLAMVAVAIKVQAIAAVAIVALFLVVHRALELRAEQRAQPSGLVGRVVRDRYSWLLVTAVAAAGLVQVAWLSLRAAAAITENAARYAAIEASSPLTLAALVDEAFRFLKSPGSTGLSSGLVGDIVAPIVAALSIAGLVALALMARTGRDERLYAWVVLVISLGMGPALALSARLVAGYYFALPARYGLILLPFFVVAAALLLRDARRTGHVMLVVGGVAAIAAIVT